MIRHQKATPGNVAQIYELEEQIFGDTAWSEEAILQEVTGPYRHYLVVLDGENRVQGYGGVLVVAGDGDLQTIALSPELRGSGRGRKLLTELLEEAKNLGAKQIFLEVRADNLGATELYLSEGFTVIGTRPGYYQPDGVDAKVMRLDLRGWRGKNEN